MSASLSSDKLSTPAKKSPAVFMLSTIGDTTWRMFAPTLIGIVGGYALDNMLHTKPWLFILGTILGLIGAGLLVKQQLQKKI
ncbi:MAG TPA: AtpZ/AtpI family protein [Candidatus Saccharimonadales bacterium]